FQSVISLFCPRVPLLIIPRFFVACCAPLRALPSFPTRRSSDLCGRQGPARAPRVWVPRGVRAPGAAVRRGRTHLGGPLTGGAGPDRKSTRLNSSHVSISYAVFCLKKKKKSHPTSSAL